MASESMQGGTPDMGGGAPETGGAFSGRIGPLFKLMLVTSLLTVITLGIYRFWQKNRIRQYYWSNFRLGGDAFEYTGRGLELLLGFLIAIFFLAIYLFAVNFALSFFSLAYWQGFEPAVFLSLLTVIPFLPYAQYRAQRYILSRTRWRGIRFGLELAAWRYAGAYLLWTLATILTLGLLSPVATFNLRKFITDRSYYGESRLRLVGGSGGLYRGFLPLYLWVIVFVVVGAYLNASQLFDPLAPAEPSPAQVLLMMLVYIGALLTYIWYAAFQLRYFLNRTEIDTGARLASSLRPLRYVGISIGGLLLTALAVFVTVIVLSAAGGVVFALIGPQLGADAPPPLTEEGGIGPEHLAYIWPMLLIFALVYVVVFLVGAVCMQIFIVRPLTAHAANTLAVENLHALSEVKQRPEEAEHQAEGFADALDVGAF